MKNNLVPFKQTLYEFNYLQTSGPTFLSMQECVYAFVWDTDAACAIQKPMKGDSCVVQDPNSNYTLDLNPLKRKQDEPYTVTTPGTTPKTFTVRLPLSVNFTTLFV